MLFVRAFLGTQGHLNIKNLLGVQIILRLAVQFCVFNVFVTKFISASSTNNFHVL